MQTDSSRQSSNRFRQVQSTELQKHGDERGQIRQTTDIATTDLDIQTVPKISCFPFKDGHWKLIVTSLLKAYSTSTSKNGHFDVSDKFGDVDDAIAVLLVTLLQSGGVNAFRCCSLLLMPFKLLQFPERDLQRVRLPCTFIHKNNTKTNHVFQRWLNIGMADPLHEKKGIAG
ncbi:hypothetical protein Tco_0601753 [Tanacetum coccineum]